MSHAACVYVKFIAKNDNDLMMIMMIVVDVEYSHIFLVNWTLFDKRSIFM